MRNPVVILGVILLLLAFAVMAIFIVIPAILPSVNDAPFIRDTLQTLLCTEGETLTDHHATYTSPGRTVTTLTMSCVGNEQRDQRARDVTGQAILYGIVGYLVPFLTGLFMVIAGVNRRRRMVTQGYTLADSENSSMYNPSNMNTAGISVNVDPDGQVTVTLPDGRVLTGHQTKFSASGGVASLTTRLKELKAAYDAGLITQSEFEAKHEEILKEM